MGAIFKKVIDMRSVVDVKGDLIINEARNVNTYIFGVKVSEQNYERNNKHYDGEEFKPTKQLGFQKAKK